MAHCGVHLGEDEEEDLDFVNALCCGPAHVGEEEHGGGLAEAGDQARRHQHGGAGGRQVQQGAHHLVGRR